MKKILTTILFILLCGACYSFGVTTYERIVINGMIDEFMAKGVKVGETLDLIYYEIPNENADDEYNAFSNSTKKELGQPGDIICAFGSNFPDLPPLHFFIDYYFGFHSAIVMGDDIVGEAVITSVQSPDDILFNMLWPRDVDYPENVFGSTGVKKKNSNYFIKRGKWFNNYYNGYYTNSIMGMRVKGITDNDRKNVVKSAEQIIESDQIYNYLFFLNGDGGKKYKAYYCTSFIEAAFDQVKPENRDKPYDVNYDNFTTCINDIVLSDDLYIFSYFRVNEDGMGEVYYLQGNKTWNYGEDNENK